MNQTERASLSVSPSQPAAVVVVPETGMRTADRVAQPTVVTEDTTEEVTVELEPAVMRFVLSDHYTDSVNAVKTNFKLTDEDAMFIDDLDRLVMGGQLDLESYLVALEDEFAQKMKDDERDRMYSQLLSERFVPLGDLIVPTAEEVAKAEGLTLPSTPHYRVYTKPLSYSGVTSEVAETAGVSLTGGPLRERLRALVAGKAKGDVVDAQILETLTRGSDFGGLGLDKAGASKILVAMQDILKRVKVMTEDEYSAWLSRGAEMPKKVTRPPTDEEMEIDAIKKEMLPPKPEVKSVSEQAVEATLERITYKPKGDYLIKRMRNAVSSRLRDVRSSIEFKQLLTRSSKVGGLDMSPEDAEQVVKQVETCYQEFHQSVVTEEKRKIEVQLSEQKQKIEDRRKQEAEEHATWFEEKIRARRAGETQAAEVLGKLRKLETKEKTAEEAKFGPMVASSESGSRKLEAGSKKAPDGIKVSKASAELTKEVAPISVDVVRQGTGPRLMGLAGELGSITMDEFRRIDKNPEQAAQKLMQKIEILGQESPDKRMEGIKLFKASPLHSTYVSLVGESFRAGKPVFALADEKRKAGENTLSPDEIKAIIQLNSKLKF
ncbi:MAG: hypothetical protein ABII13_04155 [Patescibacteria group bacterium]|nr:hypothetical protein [Patescibacteria group bacterium]MBU2509615.1 hypothetical protein [Patescibacteria group bacterium]